MSNFVAEGVTELVLVERDVDSGLDSQRSLVAESSSMSDDRLSFGVGLAQIQGRGRRSTSISPTMVDHRTEGGRRSRGKSLDYEGGHRSSLSPRRDGTGRSDAGGKSSYFKSPLELDMEKKLEEERVSEIVLRRVKDAKMKELAIAQVLR